MTCTTAIRPYPTQYVSAAGRDERKFTLRPIRPEGRAAGSEFHHQLSEQSVYFRYFSPIKLDARVAKCAASSPKCFIGL